MSPSKAPEFTAPTKVCPHCGAQAQTVASKCPNCGKKYKKRSHTFLKVTLGVLLGGCLLIVGCVALIGGTANEVSKHLDAEQRAHAITPGQFRSIPIGMRESAVIARLGKKPERRQSFTNKGFLKNEPSNSSCIYYNESGASFGNVYQFCFTKKRLESKNAW